MQNIGRFIDFLIEFGVQKEYGFIPADLYEKGNVPKVSCNFCCFCPSFWVIERGK